MLASVRHILLRPLRGASGLAGAGGASLSVRGASSSGAQSWAVAASGREPLQARSITGVRRDDLAGALLVTWADGAPPQRSTFPYVYLRDNCDTNYSQDTNQRQVLLADLPLDVVPLGEPTVDDGGVRVAWSDGHSSHYSARWLEEHCFSEENRRRRRHLIYRSRPVLWDRAFMEQKLKKFSFADLISDDVSLHDWLEEVETVGLAVICDTPPLPGQVNVLAKRVPFLRPTHFGEKFDVKAKFNPTNLAFTDGGLALHTDLPQLQYSPGIQLLHCIVQAPTGGDSIFTDGFQAAQVLREQYPHYFHVLSTTLVDFADVGSDYITFYMASKHYTIQLDDYGEYDKISIANTSRSSYLDVKVEDVRTFYKALQTFDRLLYNDNLLLSYRMEQGDIVCFNNTRVIHGRKAFTCSSTPGGERWLQGTYFDPDLFRSNLRVLKEQLGYINPARTNYK